MKLQTISFLGLLIFGTPIIFAQEQDEGNTKKTPVIVSHGFGANSIRPYLFYTAGNEELLAFLYGETPETFQQRRYLFDERLHKVFSFNYGDILIDMGIYGSIPNPFNACIAQQRDMENLKMTLDKIEGGRVIGFGHSRGAATWLTLLGNTTYENKMSLLILEAPFATMKSTAFFRWISQFLLIIHKIFVDIDTNHWGERLFNCVFGAYRFNDIEPIKVACKIDSSIPILIVHTKNDEIIPINDSRDLYIALKESGHNVYLFEPDEGDHTALLTANGCDEYVFLVHALYKHYQLPFREEYASQIKEISAYQPTIQEVMKRKVKIDSESSPQENIPSQAALNVDGTFSF